MKLIKLNTDHYVVVDNSEIKEGDCVLSKLNEIVVFGSNYTSSLYKKITHSNIGHLYQDSILPLSLQEVKELIGEVDAEKKAEEVFPIISGAHPNINWDRANLQEGFVTGYNQALENNKEKKYTEEDMRKAIAMGYDWCHQKDIPNDWMINNFIQSLQPKTEWEVEFIDGKLKLK